MARKTTTPRRRSAAPAVRTPHAAEPAKPAKTVKASKASKASSPARAAPTRPHAPISASVSAPVADHAAAVCAGLARLRKRRRAGAAQEDRIDAALVRLEAEYRRLLSQD